MSWPNASTCLFRRGSAAGQAGLAAQRDETVRTTIDRLAADVQRLRELVA